MNLYEVLEEAIESDNIATKEKLTQQCFEYCSQNELIDEPKFEAKILQLLLMQLFVKLLNLEH